MIILRSCLLFSLCLILTSLASFAMDCEEIPLHSLTSARREALNKQIEKEREIFLNKTFNEGDLMVNLFFPDSIDTKLIQIQDDGLATQYWVKQGETYTITKTTFGIAPSWSSTTPQRVKRLDGKFANKTNASGATSLGRIDCRNPQSTGIPGISSVRLSSLAEEAREDLQHMRKQRLPEAVQNLPPQPPRTKVERKPTQEELNQIVQKQKEERLTQLNKFTQNASNLRRDILNKEDEKKEIILLNACLAFLNKNIDNATSFSILAGQFESKFNKLKCAEATAFKAMSQNQEIPLYPQALQGGGEEQQAIKENAKQQIKAQEKKEESHVKRPNAKPLPETPEEQKEDLKDKDKGKTKKVYIFQSVPVHSIITQLQNTSKEDSSFENVKISREKLKNFVEFLKEAEKKERTNQGNSLEDEKLGYYYKPAKGSHTTAKLGHGSTRMEFSQQGEHLLTIPQMQDLKSVLILKGLIKDND